MELFQQAEHEVTLRAIESIHATDGRASQVVIGRSLVSSNRVSKSIQVGLVADEPIRLEGLISIFEAPPAEGQPRLVPVTGTLEALLSSDALGYMVLDLNASSGSLDALDFVRRTRPDLRLIVLGPVGNDELVLNAIIGGARAYLDLTAGPDTVRMAIQAVTSGSIWAPRRLLSKLIDRLLHARDTSLTNTNAQLTAREQQVLSLILHARSNREIARQLGIEERTVKAHVGRLMRKAGVENRIELSMRAINLSLGGGSEASAKGKSKATEGIDS
jgi:DNA-binding NarL/FixJ family response regulator